MNRYSLLGVLIGLSLNLFAQKSKTEIENERWYRNYERSERNWQSTAVKELLEKKLDESKASRESTQKWILEKLNSYMHNSYTVEGSEYWDPVYNKTSHHYYTYDILSKNISFEGKYLIIKYSFKISSTSDKTDYKDWTDRVDISNLQNISYDFKTIKLWGFDDSKTEIWFQFDRETDIGFRMKKAFVHLCSFYWKKINNETF